jgi:plastocyanin
MLQVSSDSDETTSKLEIILIVVFVLLFAGGVFLASYWFLNRNSNMQPQDSEIVAESEPEVNYVALDSNKNEDIRVDIQAGEYIQFTPTDGKDHQIMQSGEGEHGDEVLDSGVFNADQGYKVRFSDAGEYILKDTTNPNMKIRINVKN